MTLTKEEQLKIIRQRRNELLNLSDIDVLKILESGSAVSDAWKKYRQDLRDITKTYQSLSDKDFKFPKKPTE